MEQYCSELKVFRQSVTLRVFWKLGSFKIHDVTSCGWKRAVTKHGITADSTLEDVARVQHKVAYEFQLQEFAFILEDVLEHSVHVSWLLPCSVVGVLLCGLTPALLDELLIEDITLIDEEEESQHDQEVRTALVEEAVSRGDAVLVGKLVKKGADINTTNKFGETLLEAAVRWGNADMVKVLVEAGADVKAETKSGETLLEAAVGRGNADMVKVLVEAGADVKAETKSGISLLETAVWGRNADMVKVLVEAGADVKAETKFGETLLETVRSGNAYMVKVLVEAGADVKAETKSGETLLEAAVCRGNADVVKVLVEAGADVKAETEFRGQVEALLKKAAAPQPTSLSSHEIQHRTSDEHSSSDRGKLYSTGSSPSSKYSYFGHDPDSTHSSIRDSSSKHSFEDYPMRSLPLSPPERLKAVPRSTSSDPTEDTKHKLDVL